MISIVTPMLNEEENVKPFLNNLRGLEGDFELILVDGGSWDRTLSEVEIHKNGFPRRLKLLEADRGRGLQMNRGAQMAEGNILLFLHIDCLIQKDSLRLIEKLIHGKKIIGGGFRQAFLSPDLFLKLQSGIGNLRAGLTRTFYGDYGIFIRKDIFDQVGGFDNIPFLEDVEMCKKVKKYGKLIQINHSILTSPRRYLNKGKLRLIAAFTLAILLNSAGFRPRFLIKYITDK
jgi:rSAM/selenodomain-associated transferase 2